MAPRPAVSRVLPRRGTIAPRKGLASDPRARRRRTIPHAQLSLVESGEASTAYGYSFVLSDMPGDAELVEHHHRRRAQIEERIKDHKLGVSLKHLPASDQDANRTWLFASSLALNLLAMLSDLTFGPDPDHRLPRRRQAKYLRRMLLCVPARVIHHARQVTLRLPAGLRAPSPLPRPPRPPQTASHQPYK